MKCSACGTVLEDASIFCKECGNPLTENIQSYINEEISSALNELSPPPDSTPSAPYQDNNIKNDSKSTDADSDISYKTDDPGKTEYKNILKKVFEDKCVTTEERKILALKRKELDIDKNEAENIRHDVEKELGFEIHDESDLESDVIFESNENRLYYADDSCNLEVKLTNISGSNLEKVILTSYLSCLKQKDEKPVGKIRPNQSQPVYLPFHSPKAGNEVMEITIEYLDAQGNPTVYKTHVPINVTKRLEDMVGGSIHYHQHNEVKLEAKEGSHIVADMQDAVKAGSMEHKQPEKQTTYREQDNNWTRRCIFFDEDETLRRRQELFINRKFKDGEHKLQEGIYLKDKWEGLVKSGKYQTDISEKAIEELRDAEKCFMKVMEMNSDHEASLLQIRVVRNLIDEIEIKGEECLKKLQKSRQASVQPSYSVKSEPEVKLSAGCFVAKNFQKKYYVYSKDRITLGRDSKNDIALRLIPYQPKEQFPENYQKSTHISSMHAEIINKAGQFFLRDTGSNKEGSSNGTFIDGKRLTPMSDYPLKHQARINIARVLDLECDFIAEVSSLENDQETLSSCYTVLGEMTDSCFGIDRKGSINAIKIRRRNNYSDEEKYIILIREMTIGRSKSNGIFLDSEKVSDIHAKVFYRDGQYWIEDLNSRHGTWVNGNKVAPGDEASLGKQAEIIIGDVNLSFQGYE